MKLSPEQAAKFAAGRLLAAQRSPYLVDATLSLQPVIVPNGTLSEFGTTAVDQWGNMYIEPAALDRYTPADVETAIFHEAFHCYVFGHHERRAAHGLDAVLYNTAGDAEINDDLQAMGCKMLPTDILPSSFGATNGLTAEAYYAILLARRAAGGGVPRLGCGCGSGGGNALPHEPTEAPPSALRRPPVAVVRAQVAQAIRGAPQGAQGVPLGLREWAQAQLNPPTISWEERLSRAVRVGIGLRAGAVDYHYSRPSRRQAGIGHGPGRPRLPGLVAPVARVAVLFDVSASMEGDAASQGIAQVERIVRAIGATVEMVACDDAVRGHGRVADMQGVRRVLATGGGGTLLSPGFAKADATKADIIVCVTDGYLWDSPPEPKRARVIWLLTGRHVGKPPSYGERIYTDNRAT